MIRLAILLACLLPIVGIAWLVQRRRATAAASGQPFLAPAVRNAVSLLAVVLVGSAVYKVVRDIVVPPPPDAEAVAAQLSRGRTFPVRVDDAVQLDSIEGQGPLLVFNYSLTTPGITVQEAAQTVHAAHDAKLQAACVQPDVKAAMAKGFAVKFAYAYHAIPVGAVLVSPNSCLHG